MDKKKVLFVCVHNSARSQMAETYLNHYGKDKFIAESAGFEPGELNPFVVTAMKKDGFDIKNNKTQSVFELYKQGNLYSYVITVCDESQSERCPLFPGPVPVKRLHWSFADPSRFSDLSYKEAIAKTCKVREQIKAKIKEFIEQES